MTHAEALLLGRRRNFSARAAFAVVVGVGAVFAPPALARAAGYADDSKATAQPAQAKAEQSQAMPHPTLGQVQRVLDAMCAALVKGDESAYLLHVSHADAIFLKEQTYFAHDASKKPPAACAVTIDPATIEEAREGVLIADFTWTWTMPGAKERSVTFRAGFARQDDEHKAPSTGGAGASDPVWLYTGEQWLAHEGDRVRAMYDPGLEETAKAVGEAFSRVRGGVEEEFELETAALPTRTQAIKLYATMKHLQHSICLSYENGLSGWNEPGESIKVLVGRKQSTPDSFMSVLAHEYGHVATFELGPQANNMPWWALEGVADLSAENVDDKSKERTAKLVAGWARQGKLAAWDDIADFEKTPNKLMGHVYKQGQAMMDFVTDEWGKGGRNAWLRAMARGSTLDDASRAAFKVGFSDLHARWRATLPAEQARDEHTPDKAPSDKPKDQPEAKPDVKPDSKDSPAPSATPASSPGKGGGR